MLAVVEAHLVAALAAALPPALSVRAGPSPGPVDGDVVELCAVRLAVAPADDPDAGRGPAHHLEIHVFAGDGERRDFTLPDGPAGEIIEVEAPPGRPLRAADDYAIDGRTVRLMRAPPPGDRALALRVRGARARGYSERRACTIHVEARIWSEDRAILDTTSARVEAALLRALVELPNFEAPAADDLGVHARLLRPTGRWTGSDRATHPIGDKSRRRALVSLEIVGVLEVVVAVGEAEAPSIIRSIHYAPQP